MDRCDEIIKLRNEGKSYSQIGAIFGISGTRVRQIVGHDGILRLSTLGQTNGEISDILRIPEKRVTELITRHSRYAPSSRHDGLPVRLNNILKYEGYETKEDVIKGLIDGDLTPQGGSIPNYGIKSHRELCKWAGLTFDDTPQYSSPGHISHCIKYLRSRGYKVIEHGE